MTSHVHERITSSLTFHPTAFESPAQNFTPSSLLVVHAAAAADRLPLLAVGRVQAGRDLLSGAVIPRPPPIAQNAGLPELTLVNVGLAGAGVVRHPLAVF